MAKAKEDVIYGDGKPELWGAVKAYREELAKAQAGAPVSTVQAATTAKVTKAVNTANKIDVNDIETSVNALIAKIGDAKEQYTDLTTAIEAKTQELKDIHSLEVEANTLVAVVATKNQLVADKEAKAVEIIADADDRAKAIIADANDKAQTVRDGITAERAQTKQDNERAEEEYAYNFKRKKQAETDALQDTLDEKVKVIVEREEAVALREEAADDKDAEIDNLTNEIEVGKITLNTLIEEAVAKAKKGAETSANIAKSMDKKAHEAEMTIKDARIDTLEEKVNDLIEQLNIANTAVADAQEKVTTIATNALDNQKNADTVTRIAELNATGNGKR